MTDRTVPWKPLLLLREKKGDYFFMKTGRVVFSLTFDNKREISLRAKEVSTMLSIIGFSVGRCVEVKLRDNRLTHSVLYTLCLCMQAG